MRNHPAERARQIAAVERAGHDPALGTWPGDPGGPTGEARLRPRRRVVDDFDDPDPEDHPPGAGDSCPDCPGILEAGGACGDCGWSLEGEARLRDMADGLARPK